MQTITTETIVHNIHTSISTACFMMMYSSVVVVVVVAKRRVRPLRSLYFLYVIAG